MNCKLTTATYLQTLRSSKQLLHTYEQRNQYSIINAFTNSASSYPKWARISADGGIPAPPDPTPIAHFVLPCV